MSAVWVILLDVSGSMKDGFSQAGTQPPVIAETGHWKTKLDAAKEILIRQVYATTGQHVAVVPFSTHARRIFLGTVEDFRLREAEFLALDPQDQTNLAEALLLTKDDKDFEAFPAISVLLPSHSNSDHIEHCQAID